MKRYPSAIVATCVVPWNEKYEFEEDLFRAQVRAMREHLTTHLYIFGTAGEGYAVNEKQFDRVASVFREETNFPGTRGMVGVISLSLSTIIGRIERAREMGFRGFQISLPSWGALTDREVDAFFRETCGRFPDCHFLHYNLMRAKRLLNGDDYARLAARHSNLVMVKTGSDDAAFLTDLLTKAPQIQFCLGEYGYAKMRDRFECGLLISIAATNHAAAHEFFAARNDTLSALAGELRAVLDALVKSVDGAGHMDGLYDKLLYKLHAPNFPLRLLPPYEAATEEIFARFQDALPERWRPQRMEKVL